MKLVIISFWLFIYSFGIVCLPLGDFSLLKDLPAMYQHCKATEDPGLGVLEFLVEHVSGVGQIMEGIEHENELDEDGDKPHAPIYPTLLLPTSIILPLFSQLQKPRKSCLFVMSFRSTKKLYIH